MRILLFGKGGQVGWELQRSLSSMGKLVALDADNQELCGDFTHPNGIIQTIREISPNVIVNAVAYTAVDKAESEPELTRTINVLAPEILAQESLKLGAWLIHYSTEYVFDGSGIKPWMETDPTVPLNVYGSTKLEGEKAIYNSGCQHLIFRTSWVYSARGKNFAKTMIRLAQEHDHLTVIDDQIGAPTGADLLADVTAHSIRTALQQPQVSGLYHLAAKGEVSWYGYASFVLDVVRQSGIKLKVAPESVFPVTTNVFSQPVRRPKNSRLDTRKLESTFNLTLPLWQTGVARMLTEILEKQL
ncbi:MAG: dTDP-4-dehydrorhamnose reductase [Proteobacteria bacterium]|nr:dTDP-4-dehydrorhamnose reductase [Pseudomonadota bacterium]